MLLGTFRVNHMYVLEKDGTNVVVKVRVLNLSSVGQYLVGWLSRSATLCVR
jgi:hypothetical protein